MPSKSSHGVLYQYRNCRLLRKHSIYKDDLWVRDGKIVNPEILFFEEKSYADVQIDCNGAIICAGFIETQINGAFGVDFSQVPDKGTIEEGVLKVAKGLLAHGVTSFCPTVITSPPSTYHKILPHIKQCPGSKEGAGVLGTHVEGPFISREKKGAHPPEHIRIFDNGFQDVLETYGSVSDVAIVTLAPELNNSKMVIEEFIKRGIVVSLGHSQSNLVQGEEAVSQGACYITHLFNAMLPFHHRDPHLVGLLASERLPKDRTIYYGLISDGIHTHPAALRIAHRVHPQGLVLVTDAIQAMGLPEGFYVFGEQEIEIKGKRAVLAGTDTLCGSISTLDNCVRHFIKSTNCGQVLALEAASLHPAKMMGITAQKGTLEFNTDADFIVINDNLEPLATYIAGELVWENPDTQSLVVSKVKE
ncbi:N-acetylglucosamine-6-phosphate deacetylase-like [Haliotis rubra]|uniref:N-acetylglucosamine-6-phosphate deacetylase-like n=1 Tax=Haliotis rubra TaxID=36100 RepID=UPI001EE5BE72|nr:N-acetylglucosamine-6-phosphate deacetylase-like [Haliotis rubra]